MALAGRGDDPVAVVEVEVAAAGEVGEPAAGRARRQVERRQRRQRLRVEHRQHRRSRPTQIETSRPSLSKVIEAHSWAKKEESVEPGPSGPPIVFVSLW